MICKQNPIKIFFLSKGLSYYCKNIFLPKDISDCNKNIFAFQRHIILQQKHFFFSKTYHAATKAFCSPKKCHTATKTLSFSRDKSHCNEIIITTLKTNHTSEKTWQSALCEIALFVKQCYLENMFGNVCDYS